jgi:16S rRNA (guanine966-N2)-methyltransferase
VRIISGKFKGRRLIAPKSIPARPTTDCAKESLFNILNHEINWPDVEMLDLFAGIGGISIEAISRGSKSVVSIDNNYNSIRWINKMCGDLHITNLEAIKAEAQAWLIRNEQQFDLIFADPPYEFEHYETLIETVMKRTLMNEGLFILEHRQNISFEEHANFAENRKYGEVKFTFFRNIEL